MRDARLLELISAYVDGQLTVDERALVERQLESSAEYREYLRQLQKQRSLLRALPTRRPSSDLSRRVLAAIETSRSQAATLPENLELLSGYLDGVLNHDESALVQRQLAESVESRRYVAHLREQQALLKRLPRRSAPVQFVDRVQAAIDAAVPRSTNSSKVVVTVATPQRRPLWKPVLALASSVVAASALLFLVLPPSPGPNGHTPIVAGPEKPGANSVGKVSPSAPESDGGLSDDRALAVAEFRQLVSVVAVYDIYVTEKGRQAKVVEQWLKAAKIPVADTIAVDAKTEQSIFNSSSVLRDQMKDKVKIRLPGQVDPNQVEMMLVRGTNGHIDDVYQAYKRSQSLERGDAQIITDVLFSERELDILLRLNEAAGNDLAEMKADPGLLTVPSAFKVRFAGIARGGLGGFGLTSMIMSGGGDFAADSKSEQADPVGKAEPREPNRVAPMNPVLPPGAGGAGDDPERRNDPAQCLFIIRTLKN